MTDLTTILTSKNKQRDIEDITHQTNTFNFRSGKDKVIQTNSMPYIKIKITYPHLTYAEFIALRDAFEAESYSVFRCDFEEDIRSELLNDSVMNVFMFDVDSFDINITAQRTFYAGSLTIVSSVLFNTSEYSALQLTQSAYAPNTSVDNAFNALLTEINPQQVTLKYITTTISSNKGLNTSLFRPKQLKRLYTLRFIANGHYFQKLKNFYYKKGNKLGTFGLYEDGYITPNNASPTNVKVRFNMDKLDYSTTVNNLYIFNFEMIEVLNV